MGNGSDFRVTLLGSGTPIPSPERFGSATLIEAGDQKLLIDAGRGASIRLYQLGVPMGRLDAPGAKLEPTMPGFDDRTSPSVVPGLRWISSAGMTVIVANWSVTTGNSPCIGCGAAGTVSDGGAARRMIGLARTVICGSSISPCATACTQPSEIMAE